MGHGKKSKKEHFTMVFGIKVNNKPELNIRAIREAGELLSDDEIDLYKTEFITPESLKAGSELAKSMLGPVPEEFIVKNK